MIAYIDAFNFYFGLTKGTPFRWCNLKLLCEKLEPKNEIVEIKLFTGNSKPLDDPRQPERQNTYLRALEYYCNVKVTRSPFSVTKKNMHLSNGNGIVNVIYIQEKGSDVNLTTHLLIDAYFNKFDKAIVISNDSDLEQPIYNVRTVFQKAIKVYAPIKNKKNRMSDKLIRAAGQENHALIPMELVIQSQLPEIINRPGKKPLIKPFEWRDVVLSST